MRTKSTSRTSLHSRGMTLLELILALAISTMILGAVAMAIQLHLRVLDTRRAHMEESQLARAILRRMADDLRSSVQQETTDFSGLAQAAAASVSAGQNAASAALGGAGDSDSRGGGGDGGNQNPGGSQAGGGNSPGGATPGGATPGGATPGGANQGGGNQGGGNQGGGNQGGGNQGGGAGAFGGSGGAGSGSAAGGSASGGSAAGASGGSSARGGSQRATAGGFSSGGGSSTASAGATSSDTTEEADGPPLPGVYGDGVQLRIDSSRLPRVEEFDAVASGAANVNDLPSDIKTITWSLANTNSGASATSESFGGASTSGGLMRREVDRAVNGYAEYAGTVGSQDSGDELIAPEVTTLEYRYFDGSQWLTEWDMETQQALPMAVEITLGITPLETLDANGSGTASATTNVAASTAAQGANSQERRYRMVVHLPAARPAEASTDSSADASTSSEEVAP